MGYNYEEKVKATSDECFRILGLRVEVQNDVEVLKPVLEELEVIRLCCSLGMLSDVTLQDFEHEMLEAREFDGDFLRFLRNDVFQTNQASGAHGGEDDDMGSDGSSGGVRVISLFGKQSEVEQELMRLGCWMGDYEAARDQGIYCARMPAPQDTLVLFAWLHDSLFEPEQLHGTATYILRFLTCLSPNIVCCLSTADIERIQRLVASLTTGTKHAFKSYSVAFRVERQETEKDEVRCEHVKNVDLSLLSTCSASATSRRRLIKGGFPGLIVTTSAPATTRTEQRKVERNSVEELAQWIASHAKTFKVDATFASGVVDQPFCEGFLAALGKLPERELERIDERLMRDSESATEKSKKEVAAFAKRQRARLLGISDRLFSVDLLLKNVKTQKAVDVFQDCMLKFNGKDVWSQVDSATQVAVHLPARLKSNMHIFYGLFRESMDEELDDLLTRISTTTAAKGLYETYGFFTSIDDKTRKLFDGSQDAPVIPDEFRDRMAPALFNMKQVWRRAVEQTCDSTRDNLWQEQAEDKIEKLRSSSNADRPKVMTQAFEDLLSEWRDNAAADLSYTIVVRGVRGRPNHFYCVVHEDVLEPPSEQIEVFKIYLNAASSTEIRSLGVFPVKQDATILDVFSVQANAVLVVYSTCNGIHVDRVQFPNRQSSYSFLSSNRGQSCLVKNLERKATRCDFLASERLIAFVNANHDVTLYKCNEVFTSMEVVNSFNWGDRTTLPSPLSDILLLENGVFMRDGTWSSAAFSLADGLIVASLSAVDNGHGEVRSELSAISSNDHRKVPVTLPPTSPPIQLLSKDDVSVQSFGNYLLVEDPLIDHVQVFDVRVTVGSDSFRIRHSGGKQKSARRSRQPGGKDEEDAKLDHWLWAFYHVFEKFPVARLLDSGRSLARMQVKIVCSSTLSTDIVLKSCKAYFESIMGQLHKLNKPLEGMDLANNLMVVADSGAGTKRLADEIELLNTRSIHAFLQDVVTFVPIQICRAEGNMLMVMSDGQDKASHVDGLEQSRQLQSADIARSIRLGLLSPLLESWRGRCVVVTSMGKQSTGKSYFLNHLTGSSFATSDTFRTDGAWMSVRVLPDDVMLVVFDFEGIGSFERTEQEDVFLSVLNAAISTFTIFRMDMLPNLEIDSLFSKVHNGVQLIKNDTQLIENDLQLFRGLLCMSVKDVNPNDQNGVVNEVLAKFQKLLAANKEHNFLSDMFAGIEINCSPPLGTSGYYESLQPARQHIEQSLLRDKSIGFASGKELLDRLHFVLSKISALDWTSEVRFKLAGLVRTGCLIPNDYATTTDAVDERVKDDILVERDNVDVERMCRKFPEMAAKWRELDSVLRFDHIRDRDIDLRVDCSSVGDSHDGLRAIGKSMARLFELFQEKWAVPPGSKPSVAMQASFDAFLAFIVRRRKLRVLTWVKSLLGERLPDDWSAVESQFIGQLQLLFHRCSHACSQCQLGCMQPTVHTIAIEHDCGTDHHCHGRCEYCEINGGTGEMLQCSKPAGHAGKCQCADGDHSCGEECCLIRAANCGQRCVQLVKHDGMHYCSVPVHRCGMPCMATNCSGTCILSIASPHTAHKCEQTTCAEKCLMDGCSHLCGHSDHFHGQSELAAAYSVENPSGKGEEVFDAESQAPTTHMCANVHACQAMCSEKGNCCVEGSHDEPSNTSDGAHSSFKYASQDMNGFRNKCAVVLAPGQQTHAGAHTCVPTAGVRRSSVNDGATDDVLSDDEEKQSAEETTTRALHYCEARCPCCSYFCIKTLGHSGMHTTSHGSMRDTNGIYLEERKFNADESGSVETCNLYCSRMGRGHVHYLECEQQDASTCVYVGDTTDQRRHCTRVLEPKPAREMDEVLHEQFWKTLGWEDPCASQDEREDFGKCAYRCDASDHTDKASFCVLPAWHKPELKPAQEDGLSYISGHKFECSHLTGSGKIHHVFVLDCSGSMQGHPWEQLLEAYRGYMRNRVNEGASLDLVSVVTFDDESKIEYEAKSITAMMEAHLEFRGGGTRYSAGLESASEVLSRNSFETHKPLVVFFSDGQPWDANQGERLATHVHESYAKYDLKAFVVGYASFNLSVLERVAEKLRGTYHKVRMGTELMTTFQEISTSLGAHATCL